MDLEESEIELLNDIAENGSYLEDSNDELREQVSSIIRDAELSQIDQLEPDLLKKLLNASRQLLVIREFENELFMDEVRLKEKKIEELEAVGSNVADAVQDSRYIQQLQEEMQQNAADHQNEINRLNQQLQLLHQQHQDDRAQLQKEKDEALALAQQTIRSQSSATAIRDDCEMLNSELKKKRDEINLLLDSNAKIEAENRELLSVNQDMESKMAAAADEMHHLTGQYEKMKALVGSRDTKSEEVIMTLEKKDDEIKRLRREMRKKDEEADAIFVEVSAKTEQFIAINEQKELDKQKLKRKIEELERKMAIIELAPDKQRINTLQDELEALRRHCKQLEQQMQEAAVDMERNAELMQSVTSTTSPEVQVQALMEKYEKIKNEYDNLQLAQNSTENTLQETEKHLRELEEKLEKETRRRTNVESGIEGLPEARLEIDGLEKKLELREAERYRLTIGIGELDDQLAAVIVDNDDLRLKLGEEPNNFEHIAKIRKQLDLKSRNQRAELKILEKEVEKLETERIELKKELRRATQDTYQRAVSEGLTPEQFDQVHEFIASLGDENSKRISISAPKDKKIPKYKKKYEAMVHENDLLSLEIKKLAQEADFLREKSANKQTDMTEFRDLLLEFRDELQQKSTVVELHESKSLPKLIEIVENQTDQTKPPELSTETGLTNTIQEISGKLNSIQEQLASSTATSPRKVPDQSADIFTHTNFDVLRSEIEILKDESNNKQSIIDEMGIEMRKKLDIITKYEQEVKDREIEWKKERLEFEDKIGKMELEVENSASEVAACGIHLEEFKKLKETLLNAGAGEQGEENMKEYLHDSIMQLTNVRIELQKQKRIQKINEHQLKALQAKNQHFIQELAHHRGKIRAEARQIDAIRDNYEMQILSLKNDLTNTVPKSILERTEEKLEEKSLIIRNFTENKTEISLLQMKMKHLVEELKIITSEKSSIVEELKISREKCVKLEENLAKAGIDFESSETESSARKKVAILEIAELNQRQKTEHLERKNKELQIACTSSTDRINELEAHVKQLSHANIKGQAIEEKIKKELLDSIPAAEFQKQLSELNALRKDKIIHNDEITKWKNMAELEQSQNEQLRIEIKEKNKSENLMRTMLSDTPVFDDDISATNLLLKNEIRQLGDQVLHLTSRNSYLQEINDDFTLKMINYEKRLDQKDQTMIYLIRAENKRFDILNETLSELKTRFAGCVPIASIERHQLALNEMNQSQLELNAQLEQIKLDRNDLAAKIQEYQIRSLAAQEKLNLPQGGKRNLALEAKIVKWQGASEKAKLNEIALRRQIGKLENENSFFKVQIARKIDDLKSVESELEISNQKSLSIEILRAQHDAIVDQLKKHLEADAVIRREYANSLVEVQNSHLSEDLNERCSQLQSESAQLRSNLAGMTKQYNQLTQDFKLNRDLNFEKDRELVQKDQLIGEYKIKLREVGLRINAEADSELAAKQHVTSEFIGASDITAKMVMMEQQVATVETKLNTKIKELEIREGTIKRLEEKIRAQREARTKIEKDHDERLQSLREQLNNENVKRANELRATTTEYDSVAQNEENFTQKQLREEAKRNRLEAEKKTKSLQLLLDKMKKQREIQHQLQKRIKQFEENEGRYSTEMANLEEDYTAQIKDLKKQINEKIDIINNLMDDKNNIPHVSARSATNNNNNTMNSKKNHGSIAHLKQMNQRNEKMLAQLKAKIKKDEKVIVDLRAEIEEYQTNERKLVSNAKMDEINVQKFIETKTKELSNELELYKKKVKNLNSKNRTLETRESNFVQEREDQADVLQNYRIQLRDRDQLIEELRNKIKNIPERIKINTNSVVRQVRLPVDTKERNDLHDEIDNLTVKNLRLTEEFDKLQKESEQDIKLARWDEKKASEAKFKNLQEKLESRESEVKRLSGENERVKNLLIKLQNSRYRSPRKETDSNPTPTDQRVTNAKLSEANREITKLRQENESLRQSSSRKQEVKGSTSPRSTVELKNTIKKLQKENQELKISSANIMRAKNALDAEKRRNQRLENTIEELQRKVEDANRDSMVSFIENESKIEIGALQKKYDKTMERLLTIEEHVRDTGGTLPRDEFWDGLQ